jgi:hypothetical protein
MANSGLTSSERPVKTRSLFESWGASGDNRARLPGFVIKHPSVPTDATPYQVHVDSQNPHLLGRLLGQQMFEDRTHGARYQEG